MAWPAGCTVALAVIVMYEQWVPGTWSHLGPMGNPLAQHIPDLASASWAEYGHRTGIWRIRETLGELGVRGSVFASGILTETSPESLRALVSDGHEICGHGWSQDVLLPSLDAEAESAAISRCSEAIENATGLAPRGWISPRCTPRSTTAVASAKSGYSWWGDVFDADQAYTLNTIAGPILAFLFSMELNDLPLHVRHGQPLGVLFRVWRQSLATLRGESKRTHIDLTFHAHVSGRPGAASVMREILHEAVNAPGVWVATRSEIAAAYAEEGDGSIHPLLP